MKQCTKCLHTKPLTEFSKAKTKFDGLYHHCKSCASMDQASWYAANKEKKAATNKAWRDANPDKVSAKNASWNAANKERRVRVSAAYREANKEKVAATIAAWATTNKERRVRVSAAWYSANKEKISTKHSAWRKDNPHLIAAKAIRRRRSVEQATPAWANQSVLAIVYRDAREFRNNKIPATVDHIIPLNAKLACGLHNEFNVTLKLGSHNFSKCNKFDPMAFDPFDHPTPHHFTGSAS